MTTVISGRIESEAGRRVNVTRPLTHPLDYGEEGLAMQATRTCSIDGCKRERATRSLVCSMHRARLWRTGSADLIDRRPTPEQDHERFWVKVDKRGPDECWPWLGTVLDNGYGQFGAQGRRHLAHRFAYEIAIGPIPDGLTIDHVWARGCSRRDCVNPAHLEAVTQAENIARSNAASAVNGRKTHCQLGHEFRSVSDGSRYCPTCKSAKARAQRQARAK